ncbi:MAG: hypothetical protein ACKJSK_09195 [Roseibacillus sp.]
MKSRLIPAICLIVFATVVAVFLLGPWRGEERSDEGEQSVELPAPAAGRKLGDELLQSQGQPAAEPHVLQNMVALAAQLNDEDASVQDDVAVLEELIRVYTRFLGTVPAGGLNDEIVNGLLGENPKKLIFIEKGHARINERGELVDRYGTPYDFHPVSGELLEIRSAGPDKIVFTPDDVVPQ